MADLEPDYAVTWWVVGPGGEKIAWEIKMDDARLIASAPDLLAALEEMEQAWVVGHLRHDEPTVRGQAALDHARVAINKATGTETTD